MLWTHFISLKSVLWRTWGGFQLQLGSELRKATKNVWNDPSYVSADPQKGPKHEAQFLTFHTDSKTQSCSRLISILANKRGLPFLIWMLWLVLSSACTEDPSLTAQAQGWFVYDVIPASSSCELTAFLWPHWQAVTWSNCLVKPLYLPARSHSL